MVIQGCTAAGRIVAAKPIETRSWPTDYRGRLGIQAAKRDTVAERLVFYSEPFRSLLAAAGYAEWESLPFGALVGSVNLIACEGFPREPRLITRPPFVDIQWPPAEGTTWRAFGDFTPGRFGWLCCDPKKYDHPPAAVGGQSFFSYDDEAIRAALDGQRTMPLKPTRARS